ncbi:uroporphyrinogen-III synthase [Aquibacillus kalidii]|uniref:uroporphyrinogen-III synthase n=1 Tax=Aquibacillus kalidii TaxID=2762597 RepID=UPI0016491CE3|nr:uroporphyrinogen-III synthase [Aquibacillus kalidii]
MENTLAGKKILVTREKSQAKVFAEKLEEVGAIPLIAPLLTFEANYSEENQALLQELHEFTWVFFTSANGVKFFFELMELYKVDRSALQSIHIAVVGKKTAQQLHDFGLEADFCPSVFNGEEMASEFLDKYSNKERILLACGMKSRKEIPNLLKKHQVAFRKLKLYDTLLNEKAQQTLVEYISNHEIDALTFTSPSTIHAFVKLTKDYPEVQDFVMKNNLCLCIGATTERKAKRVGFSNIRVPSVYSIDGMIQELIHYFK